MSGEQCPPVKATKPSKALGACRASSKHSLRDHAQPMASLSWLQLDTPEPHSVDVLLEQQTKEEQLWTIHCLGEAIDVWYDNKCNICTTYVAHVLNHSGSFKLSDEDITKVIEKVWPHFFITHKQGLTQPLEDKITDLKGWLIYTSEQLEDLKSANRDLCEKNGQLIDLCKAKDKALHDNAQELSHL
jgi:hypothetical protein